MEDLKDYIKRIKEALTATSENLFKTVFELQPRDAGGGGGMVTTREEKVKAIVDDILDKIPDQFNMAEIMQKVEERTPYVIVAFQVFLIILYQ